MTDLSNKRKYLSYEEAINSYNEKDLLPLLQEGTVKARGQLHNLYTLDYHPDNNTPLSLPNPSEILVTAWRDSDIKKNIGTGNFDLVSRTHENMAYQNVEVEVRSIPKNTQDKGGRPSVYKWDVLFKELVVHVHENGVPENYNQWAKMLREELPYLKEQEDGGPDEKTLKDRLQPLYSRLKTGKP